jgi:hypothetical protein
MSRVNAAARIAPTKCSTHAITHELAQRFEWISLARGRVEKKRCHVLADLPQEEDTCVSYEEEECLPTCPIPCVLLLDSAQRERARERERERKRPLFMLARSLALSFSFSVSLSLSVAHSLPRSIPPSLHPPIPPSLRRTHRRTGM